MKKELPYINLFIAVCAVLLFSFVYIHADSSAVLPPKRTTVTPVPGPDAVLPSKKAEQARALRAVAEALEESSRKDLTDLKIAIHNKVLAGDFSSDRFKVKTLAVDFQELGTNFIMQVMFSLKEKE